MRAQRVETAFLSKLTDGSEDPDAAIADAFLNEPKDMARIHRYVAAAQGAYYKAMSQLSKLQKERAAGEQNAAMEMAYVQAIQQQDADIGFVSYGDSDAAFNKGIKAQAAGVAVMTASGNGHNRQHDM
jgi:hypothetical protein